MRVHRSESALLVFIAVIVAAGIVTFHAHSVLQLTTGIPDAERINNNFYLAKLLIVIGALLAAALAMGLLLILPLIRIHLREESKLREMTTLLTARSRKMELAALTDGLTGMQNRRYFDDALKEYLEQFRRIDKPVGLMIVDLDHFKQVNDTHGHDVGDEVLRAIAGCLRGMTRYHDVVARLGGEEFAIVAPNMEIDNFMRFAERIRKAIAATPIAAGDVLLKVTASVGLAIWDHKETADELYRRADQQLYEAKKGGRNRVCA